MFEVRMKKDGKIISVYYVKVEGEMTSFLVYLENKWLWLKTEDVVPFEYSE